MAGFRMSGRFALVLLAGALTIAGTAPAGVAQRHRTKKKPVQQQTPPAAVQPTPPSGPLPGFNLDQIPSSAPLVAYQSGQLTIVAQNSTLGDILRAVHAQTGASVDMPSNSTERVVGHFGPGPAREILASLLNGSHFDYVLLGTAANPNALDRVVLMARPIGPAEVPAVVANANPGNQAQPQPQPGGPAPFGHIQTPPPQPAAEDASDDSAEESADDAQADPADDQAQPAQPGSPVAPKSPEELLQQLQQQQQQQQQGAPPGAPGNPGQGPRMPMVNNPEQE
jgi:hypothetical protein